MWIHDKFGGAVISCQIQPRASRTEIVGLHGEPLRLKIRVAAPPIEGNANEALVEFLSKTLKISKSKIEVLSGHTGKFKEILIKDTQAEEISKALMKKFKA